MKKISILAVAAILSLGLASCAKETAVQKEEGATVKATIKIAPDTRAIGAAGTAATATVANGLVVLSAPGGNLTFVDIDPAVISTTGQVIDDVTLGSEVYVIANIPASTASVADVKADIKTKTVIGDVKGYVMGIESQKDVALADVVLANSATAKVPETDAGNDGVETVDVTIRPVVARIELSRVSVQAVDPAGPNAGATSATTDDINVTTFTVTGVYLTGFHTGYKVNGSSNGTIVELSSPVVAQELTDAIGYGQGDNTPSPVAASVGGRYTTAPTGGVWWYNIAAVTKPYFVVEISNVTLANAPANFTTADGQTVTSAQINTTKFYLTVTGYTGMLGATTFAPGNIYNVNDLQFSADDLGLAPHSDKVGLTVKVTVTPWVVNSIGTTLN